MQNVKPGMGFVLIRIKGGKRPKAKPFSSKVWMRSKGVQRWIVSSTINTVEWWTVSIFRSKMQWRGGGRRKSRWNTHTEKKTESRKK